MVKRAKKQSKTKLFNKNKRVKSNKNRHNNKKKQTHKKIKGGMNNREFNRKMSKMRSNRKRKLVNLPTLNQKAKVSNNLINLYNNNNLLAGVPKVKAKTNNLINLNTPPVNQNNNLIQFDSLNNVNYGLKQRNKNWREYLNSHRAQSQAALNYMPKQKINLIRNTIPVLPSNQLKEYRNILEDLQNINFRIKQAVEMNSSRVYLEILYKERDELNFKKDFLEWQVNSYPELLSLSDKNILKVL